MSDYFFIFGIHPSLSAAELINYFKNNNIEYEFKFCGLDFMVCRLQQEIDDINKHLGGAVKYGKVLKEFDNLPKVADLEDIVRPYLNKDKKFYCGFSYYPKSKAKSKKQDLFRLGLSLKKELKTGGQKVRLVDSKEVNLSSVVVSKNKLLSSEGAELILLKTDNKLLLGRTLAVQDFEGLSFRDYSRPKRDDKSGMLPPKLAQMMINIAGSNDKVLLDPFCGSGTILQEALLLGFDKIMGFDQSEKAVKDTSQNIAWLKSKYEINVNRFEIGQADVKQLGQVLGGRQVDIIVTEPDLGLPRIQRQVVDKEKKRLQELYLEAFREFYKVLKPADRIVMVWPVFFGQIYLDIIKKVENIGFTKVRPLDNKLMRTYFLNQRNNLEYSRAEQKVVREILVWQRK